MARRAKPIALPILAAALAVALSSAVRAEDDPACAKFEDPMAYNACLASHGPRAGAVVAVPDGGGAASHREAPAQGHHAAPTRHDPGAPVAERRRGRVHMEIRLR
jgi:hypothetical protein